jgi:hypothetical protein
MTILTFNFHNLLGVQIESDDPTALEFFKSEYRTSAAPLPSNTKLIRLKWTRSLSLKPSDMDFHFQKHKIFARWSYRIAWDEVGLSIEAVGNTFALPMVHHMLVHPGLRYLCTQKGALMLHGSAVVFQDQSLVFTGAGGAGKTTISSLLLKHGGKDWKLHADDYVFLKEGSQSFSYLTRSHLYRNQIGWIPAIKTMLSTRERLHLEFFGRLREITQDGIKWPLRIEASRLWPDHDVASHASLGAVILLSQGNLDQPSLKRIDITEQVVEDLLKVNFHEARHFIQLIRRDFGNEDFKHWLQNWREGERILLNRILRETALYRLELPFRQVASDQYGRELVDVLIPIACADVDWDSNG